MIIKLQDSDITTAQDDPDSEGIIHVPDAIWNHIIKEVEHPDQTFVNSLYLDVTDIEISGSGLPIIISSFDFDTTSPINTFNMTLKPAGTSQTISVPAHRSLFNVDIFDDYCILYFYHNNSGATFSVNLNQSHTIRYYLQPENIYSTILNLYNDQGVKVFSLGDNNSTDTNPNRMLIYKSFVDFLWLTS